MAYFTEFEKIQNCAIRGNYAGILGMHRISLNYSPENIEQRKKPASAVSDYEIISIPTIEMKKMENGKRLENQVTFVNRNPKDLTAILPKSTTLDK